MVDLGTTQLLKILLQLVRGCQIIVCSIDVAKGTVTLYSMEVARLTRFTEKSFFKTTWYEMIEKKSGVVDMQARADCPHETQ